MDTLKQLLFTNIRRVLLAEDDEDDQFIFTQSLMELKIDIIIDIANNGAEALEILSSDFLHTDMIFLDINMPKIDGLQCLGMIRTLRPSTPIFILSTSNKQDYINRAYQSGANGYIVKPCTFERLKEELQIVLSADWSETKSEFYLSIRND